MGSVGQKRGASFPPGIHAPSLTWFQGTQDQEIDWAVQETHLGMLVTSGIHGIVLAGTNGESVCLSTAEKGELTRLTRKVATDHGRPNLPITLGCGGQFTSHVVAETRLASEAGADFALVLTPSYFHFAMNQEAIMTFFREVADKSPIPVVIYNFPGVVAGLDVNSEMLSLLGSHPNIVGVKLTCGGIAKVARIKAEYEPEEFCAIAGQSDWLTPALAVGGHGTITGVGNLFPKFCINMYNLYKAGKTKEAEAAQLKLAQMEWGFAKGGINGTKWVVSKLLGYTMESCDCRKPYPKFTDPKQQRWILDTCGILMADEKSL